MREDVDEFDAYLNHLAQALGHADRHAGLKGYCSGLVLPLSRKSVEPMAAHIDPLHASAKHQSLQWGAIWKTLLPTGTTALKRFTDGRRKRCSARLLTPSCARVFP